MLSVGASNLRSRAFAFRNITKIIFKFFKFRKHNIFSNIAHTTRKSRIQNINRSCSKMNKRTDFRINLRLHNVNKSADIVLSLFFLSINFFRVNSRSNIVEFFSKFVSKLAANLQMSLYKSRFAFSARTDRSLFRNILRQSVKNRLFRNRIAVVDTRKIFKNVTSFHKPKL